MARSSVVEQMPVKHRVTGSNPVEPAIFDQVWNDIMKSFGVGPEYLVGTETTGVAVKEKMRSEWQAKFLI